MNPATETLIAILKHARLRWTILLLISIAGLFAALATPKAGKISTAQRSVLDHVEVLRSAGIGKLVSSKSFVGGLPVREVDAAEEAEATIRQAANTLASTGSNTRALSFFTLGPEFSSYTSAVRQLAANPISDDILDWSLNDLTALATALPSFKGRKEKAPVNSRAKIGGSTIIEVVPSFARDKADVEALLRELASKPQHAKIVARLRQALADIEQSMVTLIRAPSRSSKQVTDALSGLETAMSKEGFSRVSAIYKTALAANATEALKVGAVSVFGLLIPGLAVQLILPIFALGMALDVNVTLSRARRWAETSIGKSDLRALIELFPWIPVLILDWAKPSAGNRMLAIVGGIVHLAPPALLLPLSLSTSEVPFVESISLAAIAGLVLAQFTSLRSLISLHHIEGVSEPRRSTLDDLTTAMIKGHLERIESSWASTMTISAAVSTFFLAYLFVPSMLLGDRSSLNAAHDSRKALEVVYQQRFHEHRDTFKNWCDTNCARYDSYFFLSKGLPEDHRAYELAEATMKREPLSRYPFALSNIKDVVLEDRARLDEFDRQDLTDLVEIIYRNGLDGLSRQLKGIAEEIAKRPLPQGTIEGLSPDIQAAIRNQDIIVLPITYRKRVEIGGFAYRLTALPEKGKVLELISVMKDIGTEKVKAFDHYAVAASDFDRALGNVKLKVAGVEIDRQLARSVSPWLIIPLLGLLWLRLIVTTRALLALNDAPSASAHLAATTSSFLHTHMLSTHARLWCEGVLNLLLPLLILGLIASTPILTGQFDWAGVALLIGLSLTLLIINERANLLTLSK